MNYNISERDRSGCQWAQAERLKIKCDNRDLLIDRKYNFSHKIQNSKNSLALSTYFFRASPLEPWRTANRPLTDALCLQTFIVHKTKLPSDPMLTDLGILTYRNSRCICCLTSKRLPISSVLDEVLSREEFLLVANFDQFDRRDGADLANPRQSWFDYRF